MERTGQQCAVFKVVYSLQWTVYTVQCAVEYSVQWSGTRDRDYRWGPSTLHRNPTKTAAIWTALSPCVAAVKGQRMVDTLGKGGRMLFRSVVHKLNGNIRRKPRSQKYSRMGWTRSIKVVLIEGIFCQIFSFLACTEWCFLYRFSHRFISIFRCVFQALSPKLLLCNHLHA